VLTKEGPVLSTVKGVEAASFRLDGDHNKYDTSLLVCRCGHPLMVAIYSAVEIQGDNCDPIIMEERC